MSRYSVVVGIKDPRAQRDLEVAASASALVSRTQSLLVLVHVILPKSALDSGTALERVDSRLQDARRNLWQLAHTLTGGRSSRMRVFIDARVADTVHQGLVDAANQHAAASIFVGEGASAPAALIAQSPCSVVVSKPKATPGTPTPYVEPPLRNGDHVRKQSARSSTHVAVPAPARGQSFPTWKPS